MSFKKYTEAKNLNGKELGPQRRVVTVEYATEENMPDGETRPVVKFCELSKKMICNRTQITTLCNVLGYDGEAWPGKKVEIFGEEIPSGMYKGKWTIKVLSHAEDEITEEAF